MILEAILNWGLDMVEWLLSLALKPAEWGLQHVSYIADVANVWGYLDSFINLSVVSGLIVTIIIFDNLNVIVGFAVGLWEKIPGN